MPTSMSAFHVCMTKTMSFGMQRPDRQTTSQIKSQRSMRYYAFSGHVPDATRAAVFSRRASQDHRFLSITDSDCYNYCCQCCERLHWRLHKLARKNPSRRVMAAIATLNQAALATDCGPHLSGGSEPIPLYCPSRIVSPSTITQHEASRAICIYSGWEHLLCYRKSFTRYFD